MADGAAAVADKPAGFIRVLGLLDSTMIVAGSMIGKTPSFAARPWRVNTRVVERPSLVKAVCDPCPVAGA